MPLPQILPSSPIKRSGTAGFHPRHLVSEAEKENEISWKSRARKPGTLAGPAGGESVQETLSEEDSGSAQQYRSRLVSRPFSLSPVVLRHPRDLLQDALHATMPANSETCGMAGPFPQRDRCQCKQPRSPPGTSSSPQRPSPPPARKKRDQNSNSLHDFGLRQQFSNFAAR